MFPLHRRLRTNESIRSLVRETSLSTSVYVPHCRRRKRTSGNCFDARIFRRSIDLTVKEVQEIYALGIRAVNIYVKSVKT
jgi:porphobilinogen synthase